MNRRSMLATGSAALLAGRFSTADAQTATPVIRMGVTLNDSGLGPIYAQEQGFFKKAGLNVEIQPFANAGAAAQGVLIGAIDVGVVDCLQVANGFIHGFPVAAFAGNCMFAKTSPTLVMVTAKTSAYQTARDLEGQTIGVVGLKSLSSSATNEWLRVNGADPAKVKLFELPFPDMNTALARGTIAAALQGEPFLTAARADQRQLGFRSKRWGNPSTSTFTPRCVRG